MDPATPPNFYIVGNTDEPIFVNPGETAEVEVAFEPTEVDWYSGILYLEIHPLLDIFNLARE